MFSLRWTSWEWDDTPFTSDAGVGVSSLPVQIGWEMNAYEWTHDGCGKRHYYFCLAEDQILGSVFRFKEERKGRWTAGLNGDNIFAAAQLLLPQLYIQEGQTAVILVPILICTELCQHCWLNAVLSNFSKSTGIVDAQNAHCVSSKKPSYLSLSLSHHHQETKRITLWTVCEIITRTLHSTS